MSTLEDLVIRVEVEGIGQAKSDLESLSSTAENSLGTAESKGKSSLGSLNKAMVGGSAIAVGAFAAWGTQAFTLSTELEQMDLKAETVFGNQITAVEEWAAANSDAFGATETDIVNMAAGMADLLKPMGFSTQEASNMSTELLDLSGALSAWSGGTKSAADVAEILSSAMLGERDALKGLGISISDAEVKERALADTGKESVDQLTDQEEALATQALVLEKSTDAQEAWADGGKEAAERTNEGKVGLQELNESVTRSLTPAFETLAEIFGTVGTWMEENEGVAKLLAGAILGIAGAVLFINGIIKVATILQLLWNIAMSLNPIGLIVLGILILIGIIILLIKNWDKVVKFLKKGWQLILAGIKLLWKGIKKYFSFWKGILDKVIGWVRGLWDKAKENFNKIIDFVKGLPKKIKDAASGMWDGIKNAFKSAINWLIGAWNNLSFTLPSVTVLGVTVGGFTLSTPNIPFLADGGIITGPTLAMLGEGGNDEAVIPLPRGLRDMNGGNNNPIVITADGTMFSRLFVQMLEHLLRTNPEFRKHFSARK